ncbi:hypothetical protein [Peribacillus glennii]|uniref:Uncharacterized protein n=1 Tax=Peribacillus glennii TaxID=2303991 RepID=A0A372LFY6_9BACI|nr:hypothetical protein [Peribacillus glennii]RFU64924.1 hypothetical protein D0466_03120 [Peribacillus glennii]
MITKNKMIGTLAIGAATYMLRNKQSRDKVMTQIQSVATPENIEKLKNQLPFLKSMMSGTTTYSNTQPLLKMDTNNDTTYKDQTLQKKPLNSDGQTSYKEQSLLGTDFAQKDEDDAHSLAEAPKLL